MLMKFQNIFHDPHDIFTQNSRKCSNSWLKWTRNRTTCTKFVCCIIISISIFLACFKASFRARYSSLVPSINSNKTLKRFTWCTLQSLVRKIAKKSRGRYSLRVRFVFLFFPRPGRIVRIGVLPGLKNTRAPLDLKKRSRLLKTRLDSLVSETVNNSPRFNVSQGGESPAPDEPAEKYRHR